MMRMMCKSKIHRVTVTEANLDYEGSITVDSLLLAAADIVPYEMVQVFNIHNGQRFETYAIPGAKGSGMICLNGAAARLGEPGDKAIIVSQCIVDEADVPSHLPRVVFVDAENRQTKKTITLPNPRRSHR